MLGSLVIIILTYQASSLHAITHYRILLWLTGFWMCGNPSIHTHFHPWLQKSGRSCSGGKIIEWFQYSSQWPSPHYSFFFFFNLWICVCPWTSLYFILSYLYCLTSLAKPKIHMRRPFILQSFVIKVKYCLYNGKQNKQSCTSSQSNTNCGE